VALRGLKVVVLERRELPADKACGEGLMPKGRAALERLGALALIPEAERAPFAAIRYQQEDGGFVDGQLPAPGGLGIRRLALSSALYRRALEVGAEVRVKTALRAHHATAARVELSTDAGPLLAQVLVAADGLHSPLRAAHGLAVEHEGPRRFGLRRHFRVTPFGSRVEVHFGPGVEAYVTPAGGERVGVAFLWRDGDVDGRVGFDDLLARFPSLAERLKGAAFDSESLGAGPLLQRVKRLTAPRFALLGDAAGYVDAITGEGLSLAFCAAESLARVLPDVLKSGGAVDAFAPYEEHVRAEFEPYARLAHALVWAAHRPKLRRFVIDRLVGRPAVFSRALQTLLR
jgi:2-polyprenyl-6-methoxyphenol hydroxylase-like FAD-dependent oxidoreductase